MKDKDIKAIEKIKRQITIGNTDCIIEYFENK